MRVLQTFFCLLLVFVFLTGNAQLTQIDTIIHADSLRVLVKHLASDSMRGRYTGTVANVKAAEFIAGEFRKAGLRPLASNQGYFMPFTAHPPGKPITSYNVVAALPGKSKPEEVIIFSAHFDHIGTFFESVAYMHRGEPDKNDDIFNGANDNASGVAGIIALARYFSLLNHNERTLLFVAFSGEELGLQGSFAMMMKIEPEKVIAVLNLEMIGRPSGWRNQPFITGASLSGLRDSLNVQLARSAGLKFGKRYFREGGGPGSSLFERSDNYPFALAGIPAHTIMFSTDEDRYYHTVHDEAETLNYPLMTEVVQAVAFGCTGLVDGTITLDRLKLPKQKPLRVRDEYHRPRGVGGN